LYELRFDKLKIDRRFAQELVTSGESAIFVRAIVGLCTGLNLSITVEGIETEAQALAAFRHGVHQAQGFLFGKAVPATEVAQLLSAPAPVRTSNETAARVRPEAPSMSAVGHEPPRRQYGQRGS
jgi:EAL domain-containing protein (putative c-di-GMP-specific phosphodiesterase class I)